MKNIWKWTKEHMSFDTKLNMKIYPEKESVRDILRKAKDKVNVAVKFTFKF